MTPNVRAAKSRTALVVLIGAIVDILSDGGEMSVRQLKDSLDKRNVSYTQNQLSWILGHSTEITVELHVYTRREAERGDAK